MADHELKLNDYLEDNDGMVIFKEDGTRLLVVPSHIRIGESALPKHILYMATVSALLDDNNPELIKLIESKIDSHNNPIHVMEMVN
jgi:hypothetical protein